MYRTNKNIVSCQNFSSNRSEVSAINLTEIKNLSLDINLLGILGLIISIINIIILG